MLAVVLLSVVMLIVIYAVCVMPAVVLLSVIYAMCVLLSVGMQSVIKLSVVGATKQRNDKSGLWKIPYSLLMFTLKYKNKKKTFKN